MVTLGCHDVFANDYKYNGFFAKKENIASFLQVLKTLVSILHYDDYTARAARV